MCVEHHNDDQRTHFDNICFESTVSQADRKPTHRRNQSVADFKKITTSDGLVALAVLTIIALCCSL